MANNPGWINFKPASDEAKARLIKERRKMGCEYSPGDKEILKKVEKERKDG